ncbi:MAG: TetR/AcrR family transcriptional regulator [Salinibacterium sp.]|nr:TetR/AcrR family transcriptional regulator [Salinibacterium sp.]
MPKVSDEYREAKRDEIATAAMRAFVRKGFQATSMADIIAESGLSAGAIYGHFAGKSQLILAVAERVVGARVGEIESLSNRDPQPPPAALTRILMSGMLHDIGRPSLLLQLWGEAVTDPAVQQLATQVMHQLRGVYINYISLWQQREHGLSPADADLVATEQSLLFISVAQGYILQSALFDDFDSEAFLSSIEKYLPR